MATTNPLKLRSVVFVGDLFEGFGGRFGGYLGRMFSKVLGNFMGHVWKYIERDLDMFRGVALEVNKPIINLSKTYMSILQQFKTDQHLRVL